MCLKPSLVTGTQLKRLEAAGATYPIIEPDLLLELQQRAAENEPDKKQLVEQFKKYQPMNLSSLPRATGDRIFEVDMTYTLDRDLLDGDGNILYPRGYTFNPLDYISFPGGLVVIDGNDQAQIQWFKTTPYMENHRAKLLLTGGNAYELIQQLKRPVFYLTNDIAGRLHLTAVPSVVIQHGGKTQVREVFIPEEADEKHE